jgi:nucleoside triphosphate pyrophosphatase
MTDRHFILASGSPRRRQLLELIGVNFAVLPADVDETPLAGEAPAAYASRAARDKAIEVAASHPGRLVLGADTVVEVDQEILGKPASEDDAASMLRRLSGRSHLVHTALALVIGDTAHEVVDTAQVQFTDLTEEIIRWYVATGEPMDKAGAYAIQGLGGLLVARVEGSPNTVIGLPVHRLPELFASHDLDFWSMLKEF